MTSRHSLEALVAAADLLNVDVELGVDVRLCGDVGVGHGHNGGHVLEVCVAVNPHLSQTPVGVAYLEHAWVAGGRDLAREGSIGALYGK